MEKIWKFWNRSKCYNILMLNGNLLMLWNKDFIQSNAVLSLRKWKVILVRLYLITGNNKIVTTLSRVHWLLLLLNLNMACLREMISSKIQKELSLDLPTVTYTKVKTSLCCETINHNWETKIYYFHIRIQCNTSVFIITRTNSLKNSHKGAWSHAEFLEENTLVKPDFELNFTNAIK